MIRFRPDASENNPGVEVRIVLLTSASKHVVTQANLDIQHTESITYSMPNIFYSTAGSPPFIPDSVTPTNMNEPSMSRTWTGSTSSWVSQRSYRQSARRMVMMSRRPLRTMQRLYAGCLLNSARGAAV